MLRTLVIISWIGSGIWGEDKGKTVLMFLPLHFLLSSSLVPSNLSSSRPEGFRITAHYNANGVGGGGFVFLIFNRFPFSPESVVSCFVYRR